MSIFGSKKRIDVYSFTTPLVQPTEFALEDAVLYAILKDEPIGSSIVNTALGGMGVKVDAALRYARDHYILGLPNNHHSSSDQLDDTVVAEVIKQDLSLPHGCLVRKNFQIPLTPDTVVLPYLLDTRGLDTRSGEITQPPAEWGLPNTWRAYKLVAKIAIDDIIILPDNQTIQITYIADMQYTITYDGRPELNHVPQSEFTHQFVETQPLPTGLRMGSTYLMAGYSILNASGEAQNLVNWWYYAMDSDKYPTLKPDSDVVDGLNSYPVIPLRYDNRSISSSYEPDLYRSSKLLMKKLGMDFDTLIGGLESNPDIAEIDHAYVMFGADVQSDSPITLAYLAEFFTYLADADDETIWDALGGSTERLNSYSFGSYTNTSGVAEEVHNRSLEGSVDLVQTKVINPSETMSLTEHGLKIDITYKSITSVLINGSIGEVGHATKEITLSDTSSKTGTQRVDNSKLILRHQVATNVYREVIVTGLVHTNQIYGRHSVVTTCEDVANSEDEHNLIIPLHYTVAQRIGLMTRSTLYEESLRIVINSYVITKVKWYQRTFFKMVLFAVGVAITISTGQAWVMGLVTAAEAGIAALMLFILKTIVISAALHYATVAIAKEIGPDWAFVVAVVTVALSKKFSGNIEFLGSQIPVAEVFLQVGMSFINAANEAINMLIQDVSTEYSEFMVDAEAQEEILRAKQELLETEYTLPFSYLEPPFSHPKPETFSKPDELYNRVHVSNVGTLSLDVIENYTTVALLLPEPETI